ncbi:Uncharacterized protein dnm_021060 [Desulfonema magnum]|uniref:Uncharacterized protein n=1 Tax=Desulfonema magnum TaxID=45655 RepID=A0A975BIQ8_9BACT|nr:Uncharacterized protein dnm_021060 [Desulfonema magnum]
MQTPSGRKPRPANFSLSLFKNNISFQVVIMYKNQSYFF